MNPDETLAKEHDAHVIEGLVAENADLKARNERLHRMLCNANEQRESRNAEFDALSLKASDNARLQALLNEQAKVVRELSTQLETLKNARVQDYADWEELSEKVERLVEELGEVERFLRGRKDLGELGRHTLLSVVGTLGWIKNANNADAAMRQEPK